MNRTTACAMALALAWITASTGHAAYEIERGVVGCGATVATEGSNTLTGTTGQPVIGPTGSAEVLLHLGFWFPEETVPSDIRDALAPDALAYRLDQNQPNPFNPETQITFALAQPGPVRLCLFDIEGRKVRTLMNGELTAGLHAVTLNAIGLTSGVYFYSLRAGEFRRVRKLTLLD